MFTTLGGLILAMTACAAVLSWIEPPGPSDLVLANPAYVGRQIEQAITTTDRPRLDWAQVYIVPLTVALGDLSLLAAQSPSEQDPDHHFVVSEHGIVWSSSAWRNQEPATVAASIVVAIRPPQISKDLHLSQWIGLRALLRTLRDRLPLFHDLMPVELSPTMAGDDGSLGQVLHELLVLDGFTVVGP